MYFSTEALNPGSILDFRKLDKNQSPRDWHGKQSRQIPSFLFLGSSAFRLHFPGGTLQTLPNLFLFLWISLQEVLRISIHGRKSMVFSVFVEYFYFITDACIESRGAYPLLLNHTGLKAVYYWWCPTPWKQKIHNYFEFPEVLELPCFIRVTKKLQSAIGKSW